MSRPAKVYTPEQVKQRLRMQGVTITQWAADHGYSSVAVSRVLNGVIKAHYGKAHQIAVELGLKPSNAQPTTPAELRNPQGKAAA